MILLAAAPERPIEIAPGIRVGAANIGVDPWPSAGPLRRRSSRPDCGAQPNRCVQEARGIRPTSFSGHPDVAVTDGTRVALIECKVRDQPKPSQVNWIKTGIARKILSPDEVLILRGEFR